MEDNCRDYSDENTLWYLRIEALSIVQKHLLNGTVGRERDMTISIRSCPFSQGDIYWPHGMWSQRWGLDGPGGDSQGFHGVNPTSVTYARPGGILF